MIVDNYNHHGAISEVLELSYDTFIGKAGNTKNVMIEIDNKDIFAIEY